MTRREANDAKRLRRAVFDGVKLIAARAFGLNYGGSESTREDADRFIPITEPGDEEEFDLFETLSNGAQVDTGEKVMVRNQISYLPVRYIITSNRSVLEDAPRPRI